MPTISLPTRFIPWPIDFLKFNLPGNVEKTITRIFATTITRGDHKTPCLRWKEWYEFTHVARRQFYEHIRLACSPEIDMMKYYASGDGTVQFEFPEWCYSRSGPMRISAQVCGNPHNPVTMEEEDVFKGDGCGNPHNPVKEEESLINLNTTPLSVRKSAQVYKMPEGLQIELRELGVYSELFCEIDTALEDGYSSKDILALIKWQKDAPQKFITRLRKKTKAPSRFYDFSDRRLAGKWVPEEA